MNTMRGYATRQPRKGHRRRENVEHDLGLTMREKAVLRSILEWEANNAGKPKEIDSRGLMPQEA